MASGFQLIEQSASGMGTAFAGGSAQAQDATTIYFNPAGMTRLGGTQISIASHVIMPEAKFSNSGSSTAVGVPLKGDGGDAGSQIGVVPNLYLSQQINDRLFLGLGVNAPFGLETKYNDGWAGRYYALKSEVKTININPSMAYQVHDRISIGGGVNAQYLDAELTNAVDFGLLMDPSLSTRLDGKSKVTGDDWAWGYNLGALFDITEMTRVGIHYRSKLDYTVEGDVHFRNVPDPLKPLFTKADAKSDVDLPWTLSISAFHQFNPRWAVMADFSRTGWSDLDELRFQFDNSLPDGVETMNWNDTNRYSLGATYSPNSKWTLRAGTAYDETPVPNRKYRGARIPGEDRYWLSLGVGYKYSETFSFDIGYSHLWVKDPKIDKRAGAPGDENFTRGNLKGEYDASVDIVSAQVNMAF
jgi:long-chain fatty acid transport protein